MGEYWTCYQTFHGKITLSFLVFVCAFFRDFFSEIIGDYFTVHFNSNEIKLVASG